MQGKRRTCNGCPHLVMRQIMDARIMGCQATGLMVPAERDHRGHELRLQRVPVWCPLPDSAVVKSRTPQPRRYHSVLRISGHVHAGLVSPA